MADLTAEVVRQIVREETGQLRSEVTDGFNQLRSEMTDRVESVRSEMMHGFERVLVTMQSFNDQQEDELAGVKGRLRNHNERIAKLERDHQLR